VPKNYPIPHCRVNILILWISELVWNVSMLSTTNDNDSKNSLASGRILNFLHKSQQEAVLGVLPTSDPEDLTFFFSPRTTRAWSCVPGKFTKKFSPTLSSGTAFHIWFAQKANC
jgi:hypothetical protein